MYYYYINNANAATVSKRKKSMSNPNTHILPEFQFQAVCLSIPEIRLLVDIVTRNEEIFLENKMKLVVSLAKRIRRAEDEDGLFDDAIASAKRGSLYGDQPIKYLLFLEEQLPNEMETSYTYRIHRS